MRQDWLVVMMDQPTSIQDVEVVMYVIQTQLQVETLIEMVTVQPHFAQQQT
jgi:hypothetical protein